MTDIPARTMEEAQPVAWRWSFDNGETWNYGPLKPGDFRFGNPDIVEPLYSETALLAAEQRARKEALEEAARVANRKWREFQGPFGSQAASECAHEIELLIRALANEKEG